jgi:putative acetyltransferase
MSVANEIIIRAYTGTDLERITVLFNETVRNVNSRDYTPAQIEAWSPQPPDYAHWQRRLAALNVWVALRDGEILGFCGLSASGYLHFLYVDHGVQRTGIARSLFQKVETEIREQGVGRVITDSSITARPFFERMGFVMVREQSVQVRGMTFRNYAMEKKQFDATPDTGATHRKSRDRSGFQVDRL